MSDPVKSNLNTILLAICLGVLGWIAITTHNTARDVAAMQQSLVHSASRDSDHDREIVAIRARLSSIEIELAKLTR